jgi:hypothetical protein
MITDRVNRLNLAVFAQCLVVLFLWIQPVVAQAPPKSESETSKELTDGLLDLLVEPAGNSPKSQPQSPTRPALLPADVGLDGEDLGEESENPLKAVRQSMLIAAGFLRHGASHSETLKLQADIIQRLDDLIKELEKSSPQNSNSDQKQDANAARQLQQQLQQQAAQRRKAQALHGKENQQSEDNQENRPGNPSGEPEEMSELRAMARNAKVELVDPPSLQQNVWGQLPQRVRQQMQSRMVEQFLPAYREQIEAYFQALLK